MKICKASKAAFVALVVASIFWTQGRAAQGSALQSTTQGGAQGGVESKLVDVKANLVYPYKVNDSVSVLCMVGEFAAQHNGAVITADSAVRYEDDRIECFGDVLINKNTTYAYAERAMYDGAQNSASLYAPLVKVVDQDLTLYTYNFSFNTLDNIGYYWGGGTTTKGEDQMESRKGYYYADLKQIVGVEAVELSGEGYLLSGDSVIYEMESERAHFFEDTNIWNEDDFIAGDLGQYDKAKDQYSVQRNGYLLTREQEVWSDTMDYYKGREEAILRGNIQIDDTTNKVLAFADYAQYWGEIEQVLLTRRPTVISYDTSQGDSLFLRGDSILLVSYLWNEGPAAERALAQMDRNASALAELMGLSQGDVSEDDSFEEEVENPEDGDFEELSEGDFAVETTDIAVEVKDSIAVETTEIVVEPTARETKAAERKLAQEQRLRAQNIKDYRKLEARREKVKLRISERIERGRNVYTDSLTFKRLSREMEQSAYIQDSLKSIAQMAQEESRVDSLTIIAADSTSKGTDSLYRIAKIYRNAKLYRGDFQLSSDSLVAISRDTTMQAHYNPVVWSASHQISADEMYLYTREGELDFAEFFGKPIMSSQVTPGDMTYFNQVTGKEMVAHFRGNEIYQNDVDNSVETIYFMQDEETQEVNTISKVTSGSASFFIEDRTLDGIIYRLEPNYTFAPLEMMPSDLSYTLSDFKWYGSLRPTRESIFEGSIRPSQRAEVAEIAPPTFPISQSIEEARKRLASSGVWQDRTDGVSEEATKWMKSLGFTPGEPRAEGSDPFQL